MISETLGALLHRCSKSRALEQALPLHAAVLKTGMHSDVILSNHILNVYAKCRCMCCASKVFDEMPDRNLVSWSAMISGYDQAGNPSMAIQLFSRMRLPPDEYIFPSVISSCATLSALMLGRQMHGQALKLGCASVSFVANSLISMYMKCCSSPSDAFSVFETAAEPTRVSFNALIAGYVEYHNEHDKGFELFKSMCRRGHLPDRFTFAALLGGFMDEANDSSSSSSSSSSSLCLWMQLHCQTIKLMLHSTPFVGNLIITIFSRFGLIDEAEMAFRSIQEKDIISWNTLVAACSHCADFTKGLSVLREMTKEVHIKPDHYTYASALAVCAGLSSVRHGRQIHAHLIRGRLEEDVSVGNALVNMYAKCGCIGDAHTVFRLMGHHNIVSWNSIIAAFGNHGLGWKAFELFEQMKEAGECPDSVTFVGLLVACNHAGLVDRGRDCFNSMQEMYGIAPDVEHFSCFIDLLGRAGKLQEAEEYLEDFPFRQDRIILGSLLSAARLHGDVDMGERLARQLLKHQPSTSSPFVLLSNLYASGKVWSGAAEARRLLKGSGVKKDPGHSLIEVDGSIQKFKIGDFSHIRAAEIEATLNLLSCLEDESFSLSLH